MPGAGTTFISLCFANFICSKLGRRTAYIELNTTNEIRTLSSNRKAMEFLYKGISIFPCQTVTSLADVLHMDYEYFVLDMGVLNTYTLKEFLRCDKKFLVCSLCQWKKEKTLERIENLFHTTIINQEQFLILDNLGKKESKLSLSSKHTLKVRSFPFVSNPFQLETFLFHDISTLLKGV